MESVEPSQIHVDSIVTIIKSGELLEVDTHDISIVVNLTLSMQGDKSLVDRVDLLVLRDISDARNEIFCYEGVGISDPDGVVVLLSLKIIIMDDTVRQELNIILIIHYDVGSLVRVYVLVVMVIVVVQI